jgi:hypothetical protein
MSKIMTNKQRNNQKAEAENILKEGMDVIRASFVDPLKRLLLENDMTAKNDVLYAKAEKVAG